MKSTLQLLTLLLVLICCSTNLGRAAAPFEFKGMFRYGELEQFSIQEVVSGRSKWVSLGQSAFGAQLTGYDDERLTITLLYSGKSIELSMLKPSSLMTRRQSAITREQSILEVALSRGSAKVALPVMQEPYLSLYLAAEPSVITELVKKGHTPPRAKIETALQKLKHQGDSEKQIENAPTPQRRPSSSMKNVLPLVQTSTTVEDKIARGVVGYGKR